MLCLSVCTQERQESQKNSCIVIKIHDTRSVCVSLPHLERHKYDLEDCHSAEPPKLRLENTQYTNGQIKCKNLTAYDD